MKHVGFASEGAFDAHIQSPTVVFTRSDANNSLVVEGLPGGSGYLRDACCDLSKIQNPACRGLIVKENPKTPSGVVAE